MNLYEIDREIESCVDDETGEIIDVERIAALEISRNDKIENIGLWYKNLVSDAQALQNEIKVLQERKAKAESKAEQLKILLDFTLGGQKFETGKIQMFYRKSKAIELDEKFVEWATKNKMECFLRRKLPEPDKKMIKEAITNGEKIPYAKLIERNNLTVR